MRLIIRLLLSAIAFVFILPLINGIDFHGNFLQALMLAIVFGLMLWAVDILAVALSTIVTIGTLGVALLWLIPMWLLGFWVLPAVALKLVSDLLPSYLTVHGWAPAIVGGLVMLAMSILASALTQRHSRAL